MYMPTNKKVIKAFKEYTECRKKYPFNTVHKCKQYRKTWLRAIQKQQETDLMDMLNVIL